MAELSSLTSFTPASGESVTITVPYYGGVFAMPTVDSGNTALSIANTGLGDALVQFGTSATIQARPDMPGLFEVQAGATVLVDGPMASEVGTATYIAVAPTPGGCVLVLQRGSIATLQLAGLAAV